MEKDEANGELLSDGIKTTVKTTERESLLTRLLLLWTQYKLKSALGHFGLLLSLAVYCGVGGIVSIVLH